jgi:uncharacterized repeat protein (TIGR01451 family)
MAYAEFGAGRLITNQQRRAVLTSRLVVLWLAAVMGFPAYGGLVLFHSPVPQSVPYGTEVQCTIVVRNTGPDDSTHLVLTDFVPTDATFRLVSSEFDSATNTQGTVVLEMDTLPALGTATVVLGVTPGSIGAACNVATLTSDQTGPVLSDNRVSACFSVAQVAASADLSVGVQAGAESVIPGGSIKYLLWIRNNGPRNAINVNLTATFSGNPIILSTSPGFAVGEGAVSCNIARLDRTDSASRWVVVKPNQAGPLCCTASVTSDATDPRLDNNSATNCADVSEEPAAVHDLALVHIGAPRVVALSPQKPSQTYLVSVTMQNRSTHNEVITNLQGLVSLTVQSLGSCPDLVPTLHSGSPQPVLPLTLKSRQSTTVFFDVVFNSDCANDPAATSGASPGHDDYRYFASVHHEAIDGLPDSHPEDDMGPRSVRPPYFVDPNPDGTIRDAGVGAAKPDRTYGGDIFTDVVLNFPPNHRPVANDDAVTTPANTPVLVNVLTNDIDADGDVLKITGYSQPVNGTVSVVSNALYYVPNTNFVGEDAFTYAISDGRGGSSSATVTVTVSSANQPPIAVNDSAVTSGTTPVSINVVANDSDPDGDTLTVISFSQPANGLVTFAGNVATYTAKINFTGTNTFNYTISDGNGNTASATVTVVVLPKVNRPPVAQDDSASTTGTTPVTISVLDNDFDLDGDTLTVVSFTQPANGTVTFSGNVATYTANDSFFGTDTFTYTISDGHGNSATANVTVTVSGP